MVGDPAAPGRRVLQIQPQCVAAPGTHFTHDRATFHETTKVELNRAALETGVGHQGGDRWPASVLRVGPRGQRIQDQLDGRWKSKLAHDLDVPPGHGDCYREWCGGPASSGTAARYRLQSAAL